MSCTSCGQTNCDCPKEEINTNCLETQTFTKQCGSDPKCEIFVNQQFLASLEVLNSWTIPACDASAELSIPGLKNIAIGSFLWASAYGYFEVIGFDSTNGQVTVRNNCTDGNASAGTTVPAGTDFTVTTSPCIGTPTLFPFVAVDFTAPANSTCLDITVTNINGLMTNGNVQIGSGTYRVSAINGTTNVINICNDGAGITPGTAVIAKDASGQYQYPVTVVDANPCTAPSAVSGALLSCLSGVSAPLHSCLLGSIPVFTDVTTDAAGYAMLDSVVRMCKCLASALVLAPAQAAYTLVVNNSTGIVNGDVIQIGERTDRLTVTGVPDGTHISGNLFPVPGGIETIPVGTSVCKGSFTNVASYSPSFSASGAMTFALVTNVESSYIVKNGICTLFFSIDGTAGGVAGTHIDMTLPIPAVGPDKFNPILICNGGVLTTGLGTTNSGTKLSAYLANTTSNWTLGAVCFRGQIQYRVA